MNKSQERFNPVKKSSLYTANDARVPHYYQKPGPGSYETHIEAETGGKSVLATHTSSPSIPVHKRKNVSRLRDLFIKEHAGSPATRFLYDDYNTETRKMLNPYRGQVDRSITRVGFTRDERKSPFLVKPEHATVCQHDSNRELGQIKVSIAYNKLRSYLVLNWK
jgi:hypothetical protein